MQQDLVRKDIECIDNKSCWFILPMIADYREDLFNVRGCFIGDKDHPEYDNNIFLLLREEDSKEFKDFIKFLKKLDIYIKSYKPDRFHLMLIFEVLEKYQYEYDTFKQSKYSRFSPVYKEQVVNFYSRSNNKNELICILYKDEKRRKQIENRIGQELLADAELASAIDEMKEIYNEEMKVKTTRPNSDLIPE